MEQTINSMGLRTMDSRRTFLKKSTLAGIGLSIAPSFTHGQWDPSEKLKIGMIGVGLRGTNHLNNLLLRKDIEIVAIGQ